MNDYRRFIREATAIYIVAVRSEESLSDTAKRAQAIGKRYPNLSTDEKVWAIEAVTQALTAPIIEMPHSQFDINLN